jgi:hypothetical protein
MALQRLPIVEFPFNVFIFFKSSLYPFSLYNVNNIDTKVNFHNKKSQLCPSNISSKMIIQSD